MKKVLFVVVMMFASFVYAQETTVSKEIESAFHQKFPEGKEAKWVHKGEDFVVNFSDENTTKTAAFDEHGAWKYTKVEIGLEELPENVTASIEEKYHEANLEKAYRVFTEQSTLFTVFVKTAENETYVVKVDEEGEIIKAEKYDESHQIN